MGVRLGCFTIDHALRSHANVIWRGLLGNHDPYSSLALTMALSCYYKDEPRVTIDTDPGPFWAHRHGKVLLAATHGDMARASDMPGIVAAKYAKLWGETEYRYIYTGHLHSQKRALVSERAGAQVEVFETIAPRDAWGSSMGYTAGRSMCSITHDCDRGEVVRMTVAVEGPK